MNKRIEKIKGARSLNDVLDVVSDIAYEFKNSSAIVNKLVSSLSAEIVMDMRDTRASKEARKASVQENFKAPALADLKKHTDVVNRLHDNVLELDAAEAMIKQSFAGHKKLAPALKAIKELKADIDASLNDAFDALEAVAEKHVPSKLARTTDALVGHLIDVLPAKTYKDVFKSLYVVPDKESGQFQFCSYLGIEGLKNLQGFTYDQYYFIVTGVINKQGVMRMYINGLPNFKIPGSYPLGKEFADTNAAKKQINLLLDHNNFVVDHEKLPMPVDEQRAKTAGFTNIKGVESVEVKEDEFIAVLQPGITDRAANLVVQDLLARLNSIVGATKNDKVFQYKPVRRGTKKAIKIILVPNIGRKMNLSLQQLDEVAEQLGMSDRQKSAMRFALQH